MGGRLQYSSVSQIGIMFKFLIVVKVFLYSLVFVRALQKTPVTISLIVIMLALLISGFWRSFYGYNRSKVNNMTLSLDLILASLFYLVSYSGSFDKLFQIYLIEGTAVLSRPFTYIYAMLATVASVGFTILYELRETGQLQLPGIAELMFYVFLFLIVSMERNQREQKFVYETMTKELKYANHLLKESMVLNESLAAEAERRRIVGEIHDSLGYNLTGLIVTLEAGKKLVNHDVKEGNTYLDKALHISREALQSIREVVSEKRESNFEFELTPRLIGLVQEVRSLTGLHVDIDSTIQDSWLSGAEQFNMYRIFQEAFTNTLRHANASQAVISLSGSQEVLYFSYWDNGSGINKINIGNGLQGMQERCVELGGIICFQSQVGGGFKIEGCIDRRGKKNG